MQQRTKRSIMAAICAAAAIGAAGCGGSGGGTTAKTAKGSESATPKEPFPGMSGNEIADQAVKTMRSISSVTFDYDGVIEGAKGKFHLTSNKQGDCEGSMTFNEGTVKLRLVNNKLYFKANAAFWAAQGDKNGLASSLVGKRWLRASTSDPNFKDLADACNPDALFSKLSNDEEGVMYRGKVTTLGTMKTMVFNNVDHGVRETVYVAAEGKPYILKMATKGGKEPATIIFTDFNKPFNVQVPPAAQVIDARSLSA